MARADGADHWQAHARQWARIGSPLRPGAADVAVMRAILGPEPGLGLLLGVTVELTALSARMVALERDADMIASQWAPRGPGQSVRQGDWLAQPFDAGSFDFAAGDGSLNMLRYGDDYARLFGQLRACLRDGALLVLRVFCADEHNETPQAVVDAALRGGIGSFHAFKWRLAMALAARAGRPDIAVAAIHAAFERLLPQRAPLLRQTGWTHADVATIDVYHASPAVYSFPTLRQLRLAVPAGFEELGVHHGAYELAERCPILALRLCK